MFTTLRYADILREERARRGLLRRSWLSDRLKAPPVPPDPDPIPSPVPTEDGQPTMTAWTGHWVYAPSEVIPP